MVATVDVIVVTVGLVVVVVIMVVMMVAIVEWGFLRIHDGLLLHFS